MSTVNAVRARLLALWDSFLHLRDQEEGRFRESIGGPPPGEPAQKAENENVACASPDRPRPLADLVAERQQEVSTPVVPAETATGDAVPDLTKLIAQRQAEFRVRSGTDEKKD